jgi:hypothetical protein
MKLGTRIPSVSVNLTPERFERWYGGMAGGLSVHIDDGAARREGLPAAFAVGPDIINLAHRSAMEFFEEGWVQGGKADLTVARPTYAKEFLTSNGFVKGIELLPDGSMRLICEVWVENQTGEKKVVGTVSGIVK